MKKESEIIFFSEGDEEVKIQILYQGESFWMTQKKIAELFEIQRPAITKHLKNIFESGELIENSVSSKMEHTAEDGKNYNTKFYNLDVIIAIGYRINSKKATRFRIWATKTLNEYIVKGFVLDDERLKQNRGFGQDYFNELLERIREIRSSERRFYQKITDLYTTSIDYQKGDEITKVFFATVQNKLHWAISGKTAAEIIYTTADAEKAHMGLTNWKKSPDGKILKSDIRIAKNYLNKEHITELNRLVSAYLDLAENRAKRFQETKMEDWVKFIDGFLQLSEYPILRERGSITNLEAKLKAEGEFEKFRVIQDQNYISDFDKQIRITFDSERE